MPPLGTFYLILVTIFDPNNFKMLYRGDIVEIDTWITRAGKNSVRRDWLVRDYKTGYILAKATRYALAIVFRETNCFLMFTHLNPLWPNQ